MIVVSKGLRDLLNDLGNKICSYVKVYNIVVHIGYPLELLKDIPKQTDTDVMVSQVLFSWWGNSKMGVGRNINNLQSAFEAEGYGNRFTNVICKYPELEKLAQNDTKREKGPLKAHRLMIENLVAVPDRAPPRMAFKGWMSSLPHDLCKLMRLLSDQIDSQELCVSICDTLAVQYKFEAKLKSMPGFWCDAAMNTMIWWLLEDIDMDGTEQLKYIQEAFATVGKQDFFHECLVVMGYSLPKIVPTQLSGCSVHFLSPNSDTLPPIPPSPQPGISGENCDACSPLNDTLNINMGQTWENKEKEEDPSEKQNKLHRSVSQDDLAIIEYEEIPVIPVDSGENMADLDSIDNASVIVCISLRMERAPVKNFKLKGFLESISPKVVFEDINKKQKCCTMSEIKEKLFPINNFGCT